VLFGRPLRFALGFSEPRWLLAATDFDADLAATDFDALLAATDFDADLAATDFGADPAPALLVVPIVAFVALVVFAALLDVAFVGFVVAFGDAATTDVTSAAFPFRFPLPFPSFICALKTGERGECVES
jgi:hypothetical protein